jgi:SAM-dependent methyltransferase
VTGASGPAAPTTRWDEDIARAWLDGGTNDAQYRLAWRLAIEVVADNTRDEPVVLDVASGPGGFLAVALDTIPAARGVWLDNFATMETEARAHLARYGDRVDYRVGDMLELESVVGAGTVDLVTSSRASHHLEGAALDEFYAQAFAVLRPGGWLANLDQTTLSDFWKPRLTAARARIITPSARVPGHPPAHPHTLEDHVRGARAAGFEHVQPVWRLAQHVLLMGRRPD